MLSRTYLEFNYAVYKYFFEDNFYEPLSVAVDEEVLKEILEHTGISEKEIIETVVEYNQDWTEFCLSGDPPTCLGIIALQVYVSSDRSRINGRRKGQAPFYESSSSMFKPRTFGNFQKKLWQTFYDFCKSKNITTCQISGQYKQSYVKYPYSQAMLSKEDFKHIANAWKLSIKDPNEEFGPEYLIDTIKMNNKNTTLIKKIERLEPEMLHYLNKQIIHLYSRWNGEDYIDVSTGSRSYEKHKYYMVYDGDDSPEFIFGESPIDLKEVFLTKKSDENYGLLFWKKDLYANWLYVPSLALSNDEKYCVAVEKDTELAKLLLTKPYDFSDIYKGYLLIFYKTGQHLNLTTAIPKTFRLESRKTELFRGGIQLGKEVYLLGAGPWIDTESEVELNGINRQASKDMLVRLPVGKYRIKISNPYNVKDFEIKDVNLYDSNGLNFGWNIRDFKINDNDWDLCGDILNYEYDEANKIRQWIDSFNPSIAFHYKDKAKIYKGLLDGK